MRGIAAWMVVLNHVQLWQSKYFPGATLLPSWLSIGEMGVDIFFVISGFIMVYVTPRAFRDWRDQAAFLIRRFTRIYPAYWAMALPLLLVWLCFPKAINSNFGNQVDVPASLFLIPNHAPLVLGVAWTLIYEIYFYCIASLIFYLGGWRRLSLVFLWFLVIAMASLLHPQSFTWSGPNVWLADLSFEFIGGMVLAHWLSFGVTRIPNIVAIAVILIAGGSAFYWATHHPRFAFAGYSHLRVLVYGLPALAIIWAVLQMELQQHWSWNAGFVWLGNRSYSTYLVHLPPLAALMLLASKVLKHPNAVEVMGLTLVILGAILVPIEIGYRYVEKPSHDLAKRLASSVLVRNALQIAKTTTVR